VIDPEVGRAPQDRDGRITISRRAEHTRTGQLHRAEADAEHGYRAQTMTVWFHPAMVLPTEVSLHRRDPVTTVRSRYRLERESRDITRLGRALSMTTRR